jgi:hypothetical protein
MTQSPDRSITQFLLLPVSLATGKCEIRLAAAGVLPLSAREVPRFPPVRTLRHPPDQVWLQMGALAGRRDILGSLRIQGAEYLTCICVNASASERGFGGHQPISLCQGLRRVLACKYLRTLHASVFSLPLASYLLTILRLGWFGMSPGWVVWRIVDRFSRANVCRSEDCGGDLRPWIDNCGGVTCA